jgi:glycine betaine/proline transport system permease protein
MSAPPATATAPATGESNDSLVRQFAGRAADYYGATFDATQRGSLGLVHLNSAAVVAGPFWGAARGVWALFWTCLATDVLALMWLAALYLRADTAAPKGGIAGAIALFAIGRLANGWAADRLYYRCYSAWRTDRATLSGVSSTRTMFAAAIMLLSVPLMLFRATQVAPSARDCRRLLDALAGTAEMTALQKTNCLLIGDFPLGQTFGNAVAQSINNGISWLTVNLAWFFDGITWTVRNVLDLLAQIFIGTPWPLMMFALVLIAWHRGGRNVALFVGGALAYIALFGFWAQAMSTLALVSAATFISIALGLPIGIWCAKRERAYKVVRPILDVMQTLPSFVYLIPAIAFFSIGKPPAVLATVIFSTPPMIRLAVLGITQVPESVKEAALAYGATDRQLLWKVELPLAIPSIMTGINQTILLSLSMSVVAALIGAGGLGYDVLFALQNVEPGRGILAGIAIAFCAMIIDRVVQATQPTKRR